MQSCHLNSVLSFNINLIGTLAFITVKGNNLVLYIHFSLDKKLTNGQHVSLYLILLFVKFSQDNK